MAYLFPAHQFAVLDADHGNSTTTGTEVTSLQISLPAAGTYCFDYRLLTQTANATTGIALGINYTGTHSKLSFNVYYVCNSSTDASSSLENDSTGSRIVEGRFSNSESSTTPNIVTDGYDAINTDTLVHIAGVIIVSTSGDLELWHASQDANETRVENGSTVEVRRFS